MFFRVQFNAYEVWDIIGYVGYGWKFPMHPNGMLLLINNDNAPKTPLWRTGWEKQYSTRKTLQSDQSYSVISLMKILPRNHLYPIGKYSFSFTPLIIMKILKDLTKNSKI